MPTRFGRNAGRIPDQVPDGIRADPLDYLSVDLDGCGEITIDLIES
jgi:hypothetical protein